MLTKRIIPVIQVRNYQIVKSRRFDDYRVVGNFEQTVAVYNRRRVDELIIQDIGASKDGSGPSPRILKVLSRDLDVPLTYGGGISSTGHIEQCLANGCDRVALNHATLDNPQLVREASAAFGSQCIVGSVDYTHQENGVMVFDHVTGKPTDVTLHDHLARLLDAGIGELLLTDVDRDGMMAGYDDKLAGLVNGVSSPVLINGGCGSPDHIADVSDHFVGCCMGSLFLYTKFGYKDVKDALSARNVLVR